MGDDVPSRRVLEHVSLFVKAMRFWNREWHRTEEAKGEVHIVGYFVMTWESL